MWTPICDRATKVIHIILPVTMLFPNAAKKSNAENSVIIRSAPDLLAKYEKNWVEHQAHSEPFTGKPN